jgi:hypothetical protein
MTLRKRPRDPAQLAKLMIDIASGEVEDRPPTAKQVRAHKAGSKGGPGGVCEMGHVGDGGYVKETA